jgi:hypothetical protein
MFESLKTGAIIMSLTSTASEALVDCYLIDKEIHNAMNKSPQFCPEHLDQAIEDYKDNKFEISRQIHIQTKVEEVKSMSTAEKKAFIETFISERTKPELTSLPSHENL